MHRRFRANPSPLRKASAAYKRPRTPPSSPFCPSARIASRTTNFVIGPPPPCRYLRSNSSPSVSHSSLPLSYLLPHDMAHLPDSFSSPYLQRINAFDARPKHTATHSRSSRLPLSHQEAINALDQTHELVSTSRTSSCPCRRPSIARMSPELATYTPSLETLSEP
jgi:hypothetical protein